MIKLQAKCRKLSSLVQSYYNKCEKCPNPPCFPLHIHVLWVKKFWQTIDLLHFGVWHENGQNLEPIIAASSFWCIGLRFDGQGF